jgi:Mlc titration factor MtfA (ptsG expression regulator)
MAPETMGIGSWFGRWRRTRAVERQPIDDAQWLRLMLRFSFFRLLSAAEQLRLRELTSLFLDSKAVSGAGGLQMSRDMQLVIAAQACLLLLNQPAHYFRKVRDILVYPGAFVVERVRPAPSGVLQDERRILTGESWSHGQVILSWEDVLEGAAVDDDGRNVVIHEFAHQLDQEKGYANGAPFLGRRERHARWSEVMSREFRRLREASLQGLPTLLSDYGATEPAEFFAVVSEVFFEQPRRLAEEHPGLYRELAAFYRVDPASFD